MYPETRLKACGLLNRAKMLTIDLNLSMKVDKKIIGKNLPEISK